MITGDNFLKDKQEMLDGLDKQIKLHLSKPDDGPGYDFMLNQYKSMRNDVAKATDYDPLPEDDGHEKDEVVYLYFRIKKLLNKILEDVIK